MHILHCMQLYNAGAGKVMKEYETYVLPSIFILLNILPPHFIIRQPDVEHFENVAHSILYFFVN